MKKGFYLKITHVKMKGMKMNMKLVDCFKHQFIIRTYIYCRPEIKGTVSVILSDTPCQDANANET